jgi:hypothetical protein
MRLVVYKFVRVLLQIESGKEAVTLIIPGNLVSVSGCGSPRPVTMELVSTASCDTDQPAWSRVTHEDLPHPKRSLIRMNAFALLMKFPLLECLPREPLVKSCDPAVRSVGTKGIKAYMDRC